MIYYNIHQDDGMVEWVAIRIDKMCADDVLYGVVCVFFFYHAAAVSAIVADVVA
jgi:hypothetical protein